MTIEGYAQTKRVCRRRTLKNLCDITVSVGSSNCRHEDLLRSEHNCMAHRCCDSCAKVNSQWPLLRYHLTSDSVSLIWWAKSKRDCVWPDGASPANLPGGDLLGLRAARFILQSSVRAKVGSIIKATVTI